MSNISESVTLKHQDCLEGMTSFDSGSVDLVVTSPPYNLGIEYNEYDDSNSRDNYLAWIEDWGQEVTRILSSNGSLFLNVGSKPTDPWVPHEVLETLRNDFVLQNEIHWIKSIAIQQKSYDEDVSVNVGHYKPINSDRFVNQCHEYIFHLTCEGDVSLDRKAIGVPYKDKTNVDRWEGDNRDLRCRGNTWFIPYNTINNRDSDRPHPATFPPELAEMAMKLHGLSDIELAMDPFLGIGSSAVAAKRLGVNFMGFEIDEQYLEQARERIGEE